MPTYCACPPADHLPGCPLGGTAVPYVRFEPVTPAPERTSWRCQGCGAQVSPDERTCPSCGPGGAPAVVLTPLELDFGGPIASAELTPPGDAPGWNG